MILTLRVAFLALLLAGGTVAADPAARPKTVRLLTIGNSFSGNATRHLADLARVAGHVLVHQPMSIGGASMEVHWARIQAHAKNPEDPAGRYGKRALDETLREGWDVVTIQQASIKSHDVATYRPFAGQLRDFVKLHAPSAELLLHETWAYRCDDPRFAPRTPPVEPSSRQAMYEGLRDAYRTIGKELGARLIPVGDAFHIADSDPEKGYRPDPAFDPKTATAPAVPDQSRSLHVGWQWKEKDGKRTLAMDGHHANAAGEYLGACVFYEALFKESVEPVAFVPKELDAERAAWLRGVAHRAVVAEAARAGR
jgi:hypothetical protein